MDRTHLIVAGSTAAAVVGVGAALGLAQPGGLEPPAGPVDSTGVTLTQLVNAVTAGRLDPFVGYEVAGIATGAMTPGSQQTIINGQSGIIKQVVVSFEDFTISLHGVEIFVDGKFVGHFRPTANESSGGIAWNPVYDLNVAFTNQVRVRALGSPNNLGVSVHYLPLP